MWQLCCARTARRPDRPTTVGDTSGINLTNGRRAPAPRLRYCRTQAVTVKRRRGVVVRSTVHFRLADNAVIYRYTVYTAYRQADVQRQPDAGPYTVTSVPLTYSMQSSTLYVNRWRIHQPGRAFGARSYLSRDYLDTRWALGMV